MKRQNTTMGARVESVRLQPQGIAPKASSRLATAGNRVNVGRIDRLRQRYINSMRPRPSAEIQWQEAET